MATNDLQVDDSNPISGLGTFSYTTTAGGYFTVSVQSTLPAASGLQVVVNKNGSAALTIGGAATNPTPTQQAIGSSVRVQCVSGDTLAVVLSSSAAADQLPNAVKSTVTIAQGEY